MLLHTPHTRIDKFIGARVGPYVALSAEAFVRALVGTFADAFICTLAALAGCGRPLSVVERVSNPGRQTPWAGLLTPFFDSLPPRLRYGRRRMPASPA